MLAGLSLDADTDVYVYNGSLLYYPKRLTVLEYTAAHPYSARELSPVQVRLRLVDLGAVEPHSDAQRVLLNACLRATAARGLRLTPLGRSGALFDLARRRPLDAANRCASSSQLPVKHEATCQFQYMVHKLYGLDSWAVSQ